jgi:hypothetical protein
LCLALAACAEPTGLQNGSGSSSGRLNEGLSPNRSRTVGFRGTGWGRVQFRQPDDGVARIFYIVWVRDLTPNTSYLLQEASGPTVCTGGASEWATIGSNGKRQDILTDPRGSAHLPLSRTAPRSLVGTQLGARLRIVENASGAVVLESDCFLFEVIL